MLDPRLVHERREGGPDLGGVRIAGTADGGIFDQLADDFFSVIGQLLAHAILDAVRGHFGTLEPVAGRVQKEIRSWFHGRVARSEIVAPGSEARCCDAVVSRPCENRTEYQQGQRSGCASQA